LPAIGAAVWAAGDAVGYVYFDGEPDTDLLIDLFGYPACLADGQPLGDGCWYVRRLTNLNERASQTPNRAGAGSSAVIRTP
jgi:hypothetical protein